MRKINNIDDYIAEFPKDTQTILTQIRETIKSLVPYVEETISYNIPAYKLNRSYLIFFAGYKRHIGMYPVSNNKEFEKDFSSFKTSGKGTIQFPLDKPIPITLIKKIIKYRVSEINKKHKDGVIT